MSGYIIAGSSDNNDLSYCENISLLLKKSFSNLIIKVIIKDATEWENYQENLCKLYGFRKLLNPLIFTSDGNLIGGKKEFEDLVSQKYNITWDEEIYNKSLNEKITKKELKRKNYEENLDDKIIKSFKNYYKINTIDENRFIMNKTRVGINDLFYKNFQNFNRKIEFKNIINYNLDYLKHEYDIFDLNSHIKNDLKIEESVKQEKNIENKKDLKKNLKVEENKESELKNVNSVSNFDNNDREEEDLLDKNNENEIDEAHSISQNNSEDLEKLENEKIIEEYKFKEINLKKNLIYEVGNYQLFYHPESLFKYHMILNFKNINFIYEDYSRINKPRFDRLNKNDASYLNSKTLNPALPFNENDLDIILKLVNELDCYLFYRILPGKEKDNLDLFNNIVHLVKKEGLVSWLSNYNNNKNFDYRISENLLDFDKLLSGLSNYYNEDEYYKNINNIKGFYSNFENKNLNFINDLNRDYLTKDSINNQINENNNNFDFEEININKNIKTQYESNSNKINDYDLDSIDNLSKNTYKEKSLNIAFDNLKKGTLSTNEKNKELNKDVSNSTVNYNKNYEKITYINPYSKEFYYFENKNYKHKFYFITKKDRENLSYLKDKIYYLIYSIAEENNIDYLDIGYNLIITKNYIFINLLNEKIQITDNYSLYLQPWNFLNIYFIPKIDNEFPESLQNNNKVVKSSDIIDILNNKINN